MCANNLYRFGRKISVTLAACALALAAANASADGVLAGQRPLSPQSLELHAAMLHAADLEKAFWICDYAATTRGVDDTPADFCIGVYDELKTRKFGGDFEQLLSWWQQNKPAEHEKLASSDR